PANRPPVITSMPTLAATVGLAYTYRVTATDPEGQPVTFLLLESPANMSIDPNTGDVVWAPTADQLGPVTVTVAARDAGGATALQRFTVAVADNNAAPVITSDPVLTVTEGGTYRYDIQATDPDGDLLRFVLDEGPAGMALDVGSNGLGGLIEGSLFGRLSWTPGAGTVGTHHVRVHVADPRGLTAAQEFDLTV